MDDKEITRILEDNGIRTPTAKTLVAFRNNGVRTSRAIERTTHLRQPEVSIATSELVNRGWLNVEYKKLPGKGRPYNVYSLAMPFQVILKAIAQEKISDLETMKGRLESLKAVA